MPPPTANSLSSRTGNALFLILIAVALFAALSYAITQSGRGGSSTSREQMELAFAEVQSAIGQLQTAVTRMTLGGVPAAKIDARITAGDWVNTDCDTDVTCQVFHRDGGGVVPRLIIKNQAAWSPDSGNYDPHNFILDGVTMFNQVLLMHTYWYDTAGRPPYLVAVFATNREFCLYYNNKLGITEDPANHPNSVTLDWLAAGWNTDLLGSGDGITNPGTNAAHMAGKEDGCLLQDGSDIYQIVAVVYKP